MSRWFRAGTSPYQTAVAMVGAKAGDLLVVIGARDPALVAELALVTGLNGQTLVVDPDPAAQAQLDGAAAQAGSLVEFREGSVATLPLDDGTQDVAVLMVPLAALAEVERERVTREAFRVLRPGGRIIVIDGEKPAGRFKTAPGERVPASELLSLLNRQGARASRQLAEVDGVAYYEARK